MLRLFSELEKLWCSSWVSGNLVLIEQINRSVIMQVVDASYILRLLFDLFRIYGLCPRFQEIPCLEQINRRVEASGGCDVYIRVVF
jgi:hypothetical protein